MSIDRFQQLRILEAILFASSEPVGERVLKGRLPEGSDLNDLLTELKGLYSNRGVHLISVGKKAWAFRTAPDLAEHLRIDTEVKRRLSRAAIETLAIIAYHQPITRAEIEEVRGVATSKGTLDILLEAQWIKPRGRRRVPGRPVTWGTSEHFLDEFGIEQLEDLPGIDELKAAGLLDSRPGIMSLGQLSDGDMSEASSNKDDNFIDDNTLLEDAQDELNANPQDKPPSEAVEETKPPA
ncbi:MAG: SMC-Scp complex subunit ScpB [Rhodospirillaceae bacterium]|nr:SMC-Scp complex subunit ScpB [Rhodospirillaceae bacterium]